MSDLVQGVVYDPNTGETLGLVSGTVELLDAQGAWISVDGLTNPGLFYVNIATTPPSLQNKKTLPLAYFVAETQVTFTDLPAGTLLITEGSSLATDEHPTEVEFDVPGTYTIELYPPPQYKSEELEVTVG